MMTGFEPGTFGIGSGYYTTEPQPLPQSAVILPHLFAMICQSECLKIELFFAQNYYGIVSCFMFTVTKSGFS